MLNHYCPNKFRIDHCNAIIMQPLRGCALLRVVLYFYKFETRYGELIFNPRRGFIIVLMHYKNYKKPRRGYIILTGQQ
jgi:hypothetical protein